MEDKHPFQPEDDAATPLTNDERSGLIPSWVTFRAELNEVEQANIAEGRIWAFQQRRRDLLQERFLKDLHTRMLGGVWFLGGEIPNDGAQHRGSRLADCGGSAGPAGRRATGGPRNLSSLPTRLPCGFITV